MRTLVLYGSTRGSTRRLVSGLDAWWHFDHDVVDVRDFGAPARLLDYDLVVFFCPTYGDDELQEDMERFLTRIAADDVDLAGLRFAVCAPGSWDGYGFFEPGAGRILRAELRARGGVEAFPPLALDAMPAVDRERFGRWCHCLDDWVRDGCPTSAS